METADRIDLIEARVSVLEETIGICQSGDQVQQKRLIHQERMATEQLHAIGTRVDSISNLLAPWGDRLGAIKLNMDGARWRIDMLDDRVERVVKVLEEHTKVLNDIRRKLPEAV